MKEERGYQGRGGNRSQGSYGYDDDYGRSNDDQYENYFQNRRPDWNDAEHMQSRGTQGYGQFGSYGPGRYSEQGSYGRGSSGQGYRSNNDYGFNRGDYSSGRQQGRFGSQYGSQNYGSQNYGSQYSGGQNYGEPGSSYGSYGRGFGSEDYGMPSSSMFSQRGGSTGGNEYGPYGRSPYESSGYGSSSYGTGSGFGSGDYSQGSDMGQNRGRHWGKGPKNFSRSDERIQEEVCERLMRQGQYDLSNVTIEVKNGEVTLDGHVDERRAKYAIEDAAESVIGVKDVNNNLRVQRSSGDDQQSFGGKGSSSTSRSSSTGSDTSSSSSKSKAV